MTDDVVDIELLAVAGAAYQALDGRDASFVFTSFPNQELVGNALENFFDTCSTVTVGALFLVAALVKLKFSPQPVRS